MVNVLLSVIALYFCSKVAMVNKRMVSSHMVLQVEAKFYNNQNVFKHNDHLTSYVGGMAQ